MPSKLLTRCASALAATLLCLVPARAAAQHEQHKPQAPPATSQLVGNVLATGGPALAGAVVQLLHGAAPDRHLMASGLTDAAGRFSIRAPAGTYTLLINYLGHAQHERVVTIVTAQKSQNIGTVRLDIAAVHLDSIAVHAERDRVQLLSGATVIDARSAATSTGGSVADLLRTVPGVELDADGRITLRGSPSVLVLLNGRRIPLTDMALAEFLKQMPASALERVESGTSASAKQDADGAAGVLNLVFRNDARQNTALRALSGSVGMDQHYSASGAATGMLGERFSWDASYSFSAMQPSTDSRTSRESLLPNDPVRLSEQDSRAQAKHRLHSLMTGVTTSLGSNLSLGTRAAFSWMSGEFRNHTDFRNTSPTGATAPSITRSSVEHDIPTREGSAVLEWTGRSARFTSNIRGSSMREDFVGDHVDGAGTTLLFSRMVSRQTDRVFQNDVAFDIGSTRIEAGQKLELRTLDVRDSMTTVAHDLVHVFDYEDEVHAGYLSAHRTFGDFTVQVGLRAETERKTVNSGETPRRVRAFPSALVQWPANDAAQMRYRLSYGRRINRPEASTLNPYAMGEDDMNSFVGNPLLRAEVSDQLELGIERYGTNTTLQLTPFLRITQDPIRPLKAVTESGRATTTWQNLTRTRAAGTDASVRTRVGRHTTALLTTSVYHLSTEGMSYRNDGVYATARANIDVRLAARTTLQWYAYRRGAQPIEQGEILPMATTELAITQTLGASESGRLTLRLSDPFASDKVAFRISDPTFVQRSSRHVSRPLVSVFLSWAVGGTPRADAANRERPPQIF